MNARRHILHVDMDAFFASVEQLDRPELRGRPVLVGGRPGARGVVAAASYEARRYGCRSAMTMSTALRLCPQAIVIAPRGRRYAEVSACIFDILEQFTPLVEPLSIDEAFLDVTGSIALLGPPDQIARDLKWRIHGGTGLTASVGVAPNKFLAKLASDLEKPDGLVIVPPEGIQEFLDPLPISRLWGVGKATLPRFESMGIRTFADVRLLAADQLRARFGEAGEQFYRLVRGIDDRPVVPDREARSISHEVTFPADVDDHEQLRNVIMIQTDHVTRRLRRHGLLAKTVTLKIRSGDFKTISRSRTLDVATDETQVIWDAAVMLFAEWSHGMPAPVRLIGLGVFQLSPHAGQQQLLFGQDQSLRHRQLDRAMDAIRDRFGDDAIGRAGA
jgi:DNA polymerase-4